MLTLTVSLGVLAATGDGERDGPEDDDTDSEETQENAALMVLPVATNGCPGPVQGNHPACELLSSAGQRGLSCPGTEEREAVALVRT